MNLNRVYKLQEGRTKKGPVLFWMSRDQRVNDNWALIYAQKLAIDLNVPLLVVFTLVPESLNAGYRQFAFMLEGLSLVQKELEKYNIPFFLEEGHARLTIPEFVLKHQISNVVTDFDPLKIKRIWKRDAIRKFELPVYEVDAHNIVPCRNAAQKQEAGAYTIRPKMDKLIIDYLDDFPELQVMKTGSFESKPIDWDKALENLPLNKEIKKVDWIKPGEAEALKKLEDFIENGLDNYNEFRNNPIKNAQSNLSPYIHFGQISTQRVLLNLQQKDLFEKAHQFIDEIFVRKELADNFCFYNPKYDTTEGFPEWGKTTLEQHKKDQREFVYSLEEFEQAKTHDDLWNAAQMEMVKRGKMHGYMRMYWAKKILEWSKTPEEAFSTALLLNDKYELDGRDANGYTGCAWAIGGLHDRSWGDRPVYGKVRYMNYSGCERKFDVKEYIENINSL